jgi:DNA repair exonuclease SbcCD ATPase subunit
LKAKLSIRDVGGLVGSHVFTLESGKLNLVESSNAGGKTSVIRALTSVLSVPKDGGFDRYVLEEAFRLGIKTDPRNPREGFVNVHAEKGVVEIEYDGISDRYAVSKDGEYIVLPEGGDQRFLLTGILSNDSRIIRQLHGLDQYEPDDFRWAVTLLSNAKGYDRIFEVLKTLEENLKEDLFRIERTLEQMSKLQEQKIKLENRLQNLDHALSELRPRFSGIEPLLEERSKLSREIDDLTVKIGEKRGEIDKITREQLNVPRKILEKAKQEKERIQEELANLRIDELEDTRKLKGPQIENEINLRRNRRSEVDGLLNLFLTAESSFRQSGKEKQFVCPLCGKGRLDSDHIREEISRLRAQRDRLNQRILELSEVKFGIERQLEHEREKAKKLREDLLAAEEDISNALEIMRGPERAIRSIRSTIAGYEQSIREKKSLLSQIAQKISKSDEQVSMEYTEKESERRHTSVELGKILQQIGQLSSVEILDVVLEPVKGKILCEKLLEVVASLISYAKERAEQEREKAANQFNNNIRTLMENLSFTGFRNVRLNKDYRLYVERLNPETGDYVYQQPQTLSTSEKLAIALVLQLALKDTYMPNLPFFIVDDIIQDFDDDRMTKITDYLAKKAENEGIFVVITKLAENVNIPRVRSL